MASDTEWLEDYLSEVLSSHAFVNPLADFVDENSSLFDDDSPEGNYLTHTDCHKKFLELMECQLETALASVGLTPEDFAALCQASPPSSRLRQIVDRLMYVDDFMFFKKLMAKRNAELNMEALREMNRAAEAAALAAAAAEAGGRGGGRGGADDEEEASIRLALELSQAGEASSGATMVTGPDDEDPELAAALRASLAEVTHRDKAAEWEEAMLEAAIQASLALEEERRRVEAEKAAAAAKEAPKPAPAAAPAVAAPPVPVASPRARGLATGVAPPLPPPGPAAAAPASPAAPIDLFPSTQLASPTAAVPSPAQAQTPQAAAQPAASSPAPPAAPTAAATSPGDPSSSSASSSLPPLRARASRSELLDFSLIPSYASARASGAEEAPSEAAASAAGSPPAPPTGGISAEEVRLRQAHLRRQRDALVAKKARERAAGGGGGSSLPMLGGSGGGGGAGAPPRLPPPPSVPTDAATLQRVRDAMTEVKRGGSSSSSSGAPASSGTSSSGGGVDELTALFSAGGLEQAAASMQHRLAAEFRNNAN